MVSSFGLPRTAIAPRVTVMPISALDSRLDDRIVVLADKIARRRGVEAAADGGERNRDRRDHVGRAR